MIEVLNACIRWAESKCIVVDKMLAGDGIALSSMPYYAYYPACNLVVAKASTLEELKLWCDMTGIAMKVCCK